MTQPTQTFKIHGAAGEVTRVDLQGAIAPQGRSSTSAAQQAEGQ
ncbi:MAG: hypothetical protein WBA43_05075 [Elainellaceae cyanobacterium]